MMRIVIDLDFQSDLSEESLSAIFGIEWELNEFVYPFKGWSDFGEILCFWASETGNIYKGAEEVEFVFMDGPYSIRVVYDRKNEIINLLPADTGRIFTTSLGELTQILINACQDAKDGLVKRKARKKDQDNFESSVLYLQRLMLQHTYDKSIR
jgi:hypothetical protein